MNVIYREKSERKIKISYQSFIPIIFNNKSDIYIYIKNK